MNYRLLISDPDLKGLRPEIKKHVKRLWKDCFFKLHLIWDDNKYHTYDAMIYTEEDAMRLWTSK